MVEDKLVKYNPLKPTEFFSKDRAVGKFNPKLFARYDAGPYWPAPLVAFIDPLSGNCGHRSISGLLNEKGSNSPFLAMYILLLSDEYLKNL